MDSEFDVAVAADAEPVYEMLPRPSAAHFPIPKVVGPGRRELAYQERLNQLESTLEATRVHEAALAAELEERERLVLLRSRELDASQRLERGCQRLLDRLEERLGEDRARLEASEQQQKRLILSLGALQRENELLQRRLELATAERRALPQRSARGAARARGGWLARIFGRA